MKSPSRPNATRAVALVLACAAWLAGSLAGCDRGAPGEPGAQLRSGWDYFRAAEFQLAQREFERALAGAPRGSDVRQHALYGLATTLALRRPEPDPDGAAARFTQLIEESPADSDLVAWSTLALARLHHVTPVGQAPDLNVVRRQYQVVIDRFPAHPAADEALLHQQSTYLIARDHDDARLALARLEQFVRERRGSPWTSAALGLIACCHDVLGDPNARLAAEIAALEAGELDASNPNANAAGSYWGIAGLAEFEVGDFDVARRYYRKLIEEFPTDQRAYAASLALKRMDAVEARLRAEAATAPAGERVATRGPSR